MNTIGTSTLGSSYRAKYFAKTLQHTLEKALVANAVCNVDRSGSKYIHNPYSSQPTAAVQTLTGTYSVSAWTITDDSLTVTDEFVYGEHIFNFEEVMTQYNLMADRMDQISYAIAAAVDLWVVNELCENGTGTYSTPAGGFTTASNIPVIIANLSAKVMGYAQAYKGLFLILENSDMVGLIQYSFGAGYSYADAALNNGFVGHIGGVDVYVVRDSTFVDATTTAVSGTKTWTNAGHRVFGVKGVATFATLNPKWEEKGVTGKTGMEVAGYTYAGFKLWTQMASLIVDITIV